MPDHLEAKYFEFTIKILPPISSYFYIIFFFKFEILKKKFLKIPRPTPGTSASLNKTIYLNTRSQTLTDANIPIRGLLSKK